FSSHSTRHSRVVREIKRVRERAPCIPFRQRGQPFHEIQCPVAETDPEYGLWSEGSNETCRASLLLLNERTHAVFVGGERGGVIATAPPQLASQDVCAKHCEGRTRTREQRRAIRRVADEPNTTSGPFRHTHLADRIEIEIVRVIETTQYLRAFPPITGEPRVQDGLLDGHVVPRQRVLCILGEHEQECRAVIP